ncbi:energy transducer TonB, partial [Hymenobacter agri]
MIDAVQARIVLPFGTPVPADTSRVVVRLVVGTLGEVADAKMVRGISPAVDEAVLNALHDNLSFRPTQRNGRYEQTPYTLVIPAPGAASAAQRREATTR